LPICLRQIVRSGFRPAGIQRLSTGQSHGMVRVSCNVSSKKRKPSCCFGWLYHSFSILSALVWKTESGTFFYHSSYAHINSHLSSYPLFHRELYPSFLYSFFPLSFHFYNIQFLIFAHNICSSSNYPLFCKHFRFMFFFLLRKYISQKFHNFHSKMATVYRTSIFSLNLIHNQPLVYSPSTGCRCITSQRGLIRNPWPIIRHTEYARYCRLHAAWEYARAEGRFCQSNERRLSHELFQERLLLHPLHR